MAAHSVTTGSPTLRAVPATSEVDQVEAAVSRLLDEVARLREFITAIKVASHSQDRNGASFAELYWPSLMEGLQRMLPNTSILEEEVPEMLSELRRLSAGASPRIGGDEGAPTGKTAKRAALGAGSSRE